ncbi:dUTP diphosphatase [Sporosarcina sp. FSL K6-3457]|uniref:dUTP diphosphatase n=1 Tax=Sporosarcina sp. FSL K6-3457 TaxID=2978204 RepID=UPI0030F9FA0D
MNLTKLFEMQKVLDQKIYDRFPGLKEEPWDWKITALLTELGECANEHRGFKRWSANQQPNTFLACGRCRGRGIAFKSILRDDPFECPKCKGGKGTNPLLEEYVDCIHFFLSIAIELNMFPQNLHVFEDHTEETIEQSFNRVFYEVSSISALRDRDAPKRVTQEDLQEILYIAFSCFVGIGEQFLGFTWNQVEDAYFAKNEVNHVRQAEGY